MVVDATPDAERPISIARRGDLLILERGKQREVARADSAAEAREIVPRLIFWATVGCPFGARTGQPWDLRALLTWVDAEHTAMRKRAQRIRSNARYRARQAA